MKWYHFQEGGAVPKPGYSPTEFFNQYTSGDYAGDLKAGLIGASKELHSLDNKYNRAADAFRAQRTRADDLQGQYTGLQDQFRLKISSVITRSILIEKLSRRITWFRYCTTFLEMTPFHTCLLYTSPSPRDRQKSRMPSSA